MLLEERAESERLRQIIKALQRHRFGRRAESLPEDQLLLGLEEAEQLEAAGHAQAEDAAPAEKAARSAKRRVNRGSLPTHLPRVETIVDVESTVCAQSCPVLVRPRPGSSTGAVVSSANSLGEAFSLTSSRSCTGRRWNAARPTQSAKVERSSVRP